MMILVDLIPIPFTKMNTNFFKLFLLCAVLVLASSTHNRCEAATTVDYTTTNWQDFGSTQTASLTGNFLDGWTAILNTPDYSTGSVFGINHQTLDGTGTDAGLWYNEAGSGVIDEEVRLSLSGFTLGTHYRLKFSASMFQDAIGGWDASSGSVDVAITDANVTTYSAPLSDPIATDGLNTWVPQWLNFTPTTSTTITFTFSATQIGAPSGGGRFGIDGFTAEPVPEPSSALFLGLGVLGFFAHRKRHQLIETFTKKNKRP